MRPTKRTATEDFIAVIVLYLPAPTAFILHGAVTIMSIPHLDLVRVLFGIFSIHPDSSFQISRPKLQG